MPAADGGDRARPRRARGRGERRTVLGTACGLGIEGSGWVARAGLVVTNAHVVAGAEGHRACELRGRQPGLDATVVAFDPRNDVAILRVPGLNAPALPLGRRR